MAMGYCGDGFLVALPRRHHLVAHAQREDRNLRVCDRPHRLWSTSGGRLLVRSATLNHLALDYDDPDVLFVDLCRRTARCGAYRRSYGSHFYQWPHRDT